MNSSQLHYWIASHRKVHSDFAHRLSSITGLKFTLISDPKELTLKRLKEEGVSRIFFPHWSHLIPENIFSQWECIIFHMTDLPYGRGGSPLQNLIERGIYQTQMSAIRCEKTIDAGPIYMKRPLDLSVGSADQIFARAAEVIFKMILDLVTHPVEPVAQKGNPVEFKRRKPEQSRIPDGLDGQRLYDFIRMLDGEGYPPAFLDYGGWKYEFTAAELKENEVRAQVRCIRLDSKNPSAK